MAGSRAGAGAGRRAAGMMDVARLAGVSHQTVSRVLNNSPQVRPETRERVLVAMRTLNYQPNSAARTLASARSHTLGIMTFDTTLTGPTSTTNGIAQAAQEAGYFVSIGTARSLRTPDVREALNRLRVQSIDGMVAIIPQEGAVAALNALSPDLPLVVVGLGQSAHTSRVGIDNGEGAATATRHLLDLGHPTVHHLSGPLDWAEARERLSGWRAALTGAGAPVPPWESGDWSSRSGYEAALRLLRQPDVTAVFCANDQMALGLLRALWEAGLRVPDDVSVVGFDDIPEAAYVPPPLTTIVQEFTQLGRTAIDLLREQLTDGPSSYRQVTLPSRLQVRASSGPPPSSTARSRRPRPR